MPESTDKWIRDATGKLTIVWPDGSRGSGTGFHIGNGYFLTAAHCCRNDKGETLRLDGKGPSFVSFDSVAKSFTISRLIIDGFSTKERLDFALFRLMGHDGIPALSLCYDDQVYDSGTSVIISHYPGGKALQSSKGIISAMDHGAEAWLALTTLYIGKEYFRYTCSTEGGSSGAPVALVDKKQIIGIHVKGEAKHQDTHIATKLSDVNAYCLARGFNLQALVNPISKNGNSTFHRKAKKVKRELDPLLEQDETETKSCCILS